MEFEELFERATGFAPFPYQKEWATREEMPSLVSVPTGLGKTAGAITSWLWRRKFSGEEMRKKTPRRLVYCLPMRVLVEQTRDCAISWLRNLSVLAEDSPDKHPADKVGVHVLMGGDLEHDWDLRGLRTAQRSGKSGSGCGEQSAGFDPRGTEDPSHPS